MGKKASCAGVVEMQRSVVSWLGEEACSFSIPLRSERNIKHERGSPTRRSGSFMSISAPFSPDWSES